MQQLQQPQADAEALWPRKSLTMKRTISSSATRQPLQELPLAAAAAGGKHAAPGSNSLAGGWPIGNIDVGAGSPSSFHGSWLPQPPPASASPTPQLPSPGASPAAAAGLTDADKTTTLLALPPLTAAADSRTGGEAWQVGLLGASQDDPPAVDKGLDTGTSFHFSRLAELADAAAAAAAVHETQLPTDFTSKPAGRRLKARYGMKQTAAAGMPAAAAAAAGGGGHTAAAAGGGGRSVDAVRAGREQRWLHAAPDPQEYHQNHPGARNHYQQQHQTAHKQHRRHHSRPYKHQQQQHQQQHQQHGSPDVRPDQQQIKHRHPQQQQDAPAVLPQPIRMPDNSSPGSDVNNPEQRPVLRRSSRSSKGRSRFTGAAVLTPVSDSSRPEGCSRSSSKPRSSRTDVIVLTPLAVQPRAAARHQQPEVAGKRKEEGAGADTAGGGAAATAGSATKRHRSTSAAAAAASGPPAPTAAEQLWVDEMPSAAPDPLSSDAARSRALAAAPPTAAAAAEQLWVNAMPFVAPSIVGSDAARSRRSAAAPTTPGADAAEGTGAVRCGNGGDAGAAAAVSRNGVAGSYHTFSTTAAAAVAASAQTQGPLTTPAALLQATGQVSGAQAAPAVLGPFKVFGAVTSDPAGVAGVTGGVGTIQELYHSAPAPAAAPASKAAAASCGSEEGWPRRSMISVQPPLPPPLPAAAAAAAAEGGPSLAEDAAAPPPPLPAAAAAAAAAGRGSCGSPVGSLASLLPHTSDWQEMVAAVTQLFMSLQTQLPLPTLLALHCQWLLAATPGQIKQCVAQYLQLQHAGAAGSSAEQLAALLVDWAHHSGSYLLAD